MKFSELFFTIRRREGWIPRTPRKTLPVPKAPLGTRIIRVFFYVLHNT